MFYTNVKTLGNKIIHIGYDDNGLKFVNKEELQPSIGVKTNLETEFKTLHDEPIELKWFEDIKSYREYVKTYKDSIELYDVINPEYKFIHFEYLNEMKYNIDLVKVLHIDIEVLSDSGFPQPQFANTPINSISIKDRTNGKYYVFGRKQYDKDKNEYVDNSNINYKACDSEENLLKYFIKTIRLLEPDILIGWNSHGFDFPYLMNRITKILGKDELKKLSPVNRASFEMAQRNDEIVFYCKIMGVTLLDYMDLYKKYMYGDRESYSLDFIANFELGETKIDYEEYDDLLALYKNDYNKFIDYNIYDAELIDQLEDKLGLIKLLCSIAYMSKCNFEDVLSPVKTWDIFIYHYLLDRKIVIPPLKVSAKFSYPGAYVHNVNTGIYDWVVSFDLNSLYPHLQMQYNISPECIVEDKHVKVDEEKIDDKFLTKEIEGDKKYCLAGNGYYFRKDKKGFLPEIFETIYNQRKQVKKEMLALEQKYEDTKDKSLKAEISQKNNIQLALKIVLNSAYGALANKYFRYFDMRLASAVTISGQLSLKWIMERVNKFVEEKYKIKDVVIYGDTDSIYLTLDKLVNLALKKKPEMTKDQIISFIDNFCNKILHPFISDSYEELSEYMNCNENKMFMGRELIAERGLWTAKKRYALNVWDSEGVRYQKEKLKVKGIEIVRSSTPKAVKEYLKDSINTLLKEPEKIQEKIIEIKKKFYELDPEEIAFPRGVNNVTKYSDEVRIYKKGTPIGVRAAIMHNKYIVENDLVGDFALIQDGSKIKFIFMKTPNAINNENIFGFVKRIPDREKIIKYVDYHTQFEKAYMSVLKNITDRVGIEVSSKNETNLDSLF
jgi:DNA polymerase elongation subunit (family B)